MKIQWLHDGDGRLLAHFIKDTQVDTGLTPPFATDHAAPARTTDAGGASPVCHQDDDEHLRAA